MPRRNKKFTNISHLEGEKPSFFIAKGLTEYNIYVRMKKELRKGRLNEKRGIKNIPRATCGGGKVQEKKPGANKNHKLQGHGKTICPTSRDKRGDGGVKRDFQKRKSECEKVLTVYNLYVRMKEKLRETTTSQ